MAICHRFDRGNDRLLKSGEVEMDVEVRDGPSAKRKVMSCSDFLVNREVACLVYKNDRDVTKLYFFFQLQHMREHRRAFKACDHRCRFTKFHRSVPVSHIW